MTSVHMTVGIAVLATNLGAGAWGAYAWIRHSPSVGFWYLLRVAQVAVVIQVTLGGILLLIGHRPIDDLHYIYGALPLLVTLLAEGARSGAAQRELVGIDFESLPAERQRAFALAIVRRETGIMAVSALVITFLALRAMETSTFFLF